MIPLHHLPLPTREVEMPSGRPEPGEYAGYATTDIAAVTGDDAFDALVAVKHATFAFFHTLTDDGIAGVRYAAGKWTMKEVLGHLIDDERIFAYRALCVSRGDTRPLPGFDEREYIAGAHFERRPLAMLLDEYWAVRSASLSLFGSLSPDEWVRRGTVNGYEASARGLAFHIAGHEYRHLRTLETRYLPMLDGVAGAS